MVFLDGTCGDKLAESQKNNFWKFGQRNPRWVAGFSQNRCQIPQRNDNCERCGGPFKCIPIVIPKKAFCFYFLFTNFIHISSLHLDVFCVSLLFSSFVSFLFLHSAFSHFLSSATVYSSFVLWQYLRNCFNCCVCLWVCKCMV